MKAAVRMDAVVASESVRGVLAQMSVETSRQNRQQPAQEIAHQADRLFSERQHGRHGMATVEQRELPYLAVLAEGVPGGKRPEEIVQVADGVDVEERILPAEPFHFVLRV